MGLEIIIPFIASVAVTIGLRRLDKSNTKLSQIKRYAEKLSEEIHQTALLKIQSVKDAGIDIDLHLKQAKRTSEDVQNLTRESQELFDQIKSGRDYLASLSSEMTNVVELAHEARSEAENLQKDLTSAFNHRQEISLLQEDMTSLREEASGILDAFQDKLDLRSDDILQSLAHKLLELEGLMEKKSQALDTTLVEIAQTARIKLNQESEHLVQETLGRVDTARREIDDIMERLSDSENTMDLKISKFEDTTSILSEKVDRFEERLEDKTSKAQVRIEEKILILEKKLTEKFDRILEQASHSKETFFDGIRVEVDSIKREIEGLSLETMTRRDEILNETRRQAENINATILDFQEKYLDAENKLLKQADSRKSELMRQIESFAEEFRGVSEELKKEADSIRKETLGELKNFHKDLEVSRNQAENESKDSILNLRTELESRLRLDITQVDSELKGLKLAISTKINDVDHYVVDLKEALTDSAREILEEAEQKAYSFENIVTKEIEGSEKKIESMISFWDEEIKKTREKALQNLEGLDERVKSIHLEGSDLVAKFSEEYQDTRKRLEDFIQAQEGCIEEESSRAQKELSDKFQVLKKTAEDFFSRQELKVDKLNENIDSRINKQLAKLVDKGNLHLGQIEEKVHKHISSLKKDLDESFRENKNEFQTFKKEIDEGIKDAMELKEEILSGVSANIDSIKDEVEDLTSKIHLAKDEMKSLEESRLAIDKSERVTEELSTILFQIDENSELLENYISSVSTVKDLKTEMELEIESLKNELHTFQELDGRSIELSMTIQKLEEESSTLKNSLFDLQQLEARIDKAVESQEILKESMEDIQSTRDSLERIERIQEEQINQSETITGKLQNLDREIEFIEAKEKSLSESIRSADDRAKHLMDREKDILNVENRFNKIETLIGDLGDRHRQALTLQKRVEDLREEAQHSKEELEGLISEADEKFEKLSAFLDIVQNSTSPEPKSRGSKVKTDPILERKKNTVLTLHDKHHWSPESISEKLNIEKSLVDTIIGTRNSR